MSWPLAFNMVGPTGSSGTAGSTGTRGSLILYGTGAPSSSTGSQNDTYIDNANGNVYSKQSNPIATDWIQRTAAGSRNWHSGVFSSDGTKLFAAVNGGGYIYSSTDDGATWTEQTGSGLRNWMDIASSSDGSKLVAVVEGGYIYTSTNSGVTWTERTGAGS